MHDGKLRDDSFCSRRQTDGVPVSTCLYDGGVGVWGGGSLIPLIDSLKSFHAVILSDLEEWFGPTEGVITSFPDT